MLHSGLILWMLYLALVVAPRVSDAPETATRNPDESTRTANPV